MCLRPGKYFGDSQMFSIYQYLQSVPNTRALLVICVLEENTRYNNCPIAYSDFIKTYFGEHNYTFNYLTSPPLKSMDVYLNLNIHVFDNSFLSYRCQVRLPCILGIVHKNGTTVLPFVCKRRV